MKENSVELLITNGFILIPFVIKYLNAFNSIVVPGKTHAIGYTFLRVHQFLSVEVNCFSIFLIRMSCNYN